MGFVIDASVAACWLFPDEGSAIADAARERMVAETAVVPAIWWFEIRNVLLVGERRNRIEPAQTTRALLLLSRLQIEVDRAADDAVLIGLARRHQLSAYDAAYLELALRQDVPLATLDTAMARAAKAEGINMV